MILACNCTYIKRKQGALILYQHKYNKIVSYWLKNNYRVTKLLIACITIPDDKIINSQMFIFIYNGTCFTFGSCCTCSIFLRYI